MADTVEQNACKSETNSSTRSGTNIKPRRWRYLGLGCKWIRIEITCHWLFVVGKDSGRKPMVKIVSHLTLCAHLTTVGGRGRSWRIWLGKTEGQRNMKSPRGKKSKPTLYLASALLNSRHACGFRCTFFNSAAPRCLWFTRYKNMVPYAIGNVFRIFDMKAFDTHC